MRIRSLSAITTDRRPLFAQCLPALDVVTPELVQSVLCALSATPAVALCDPVQIVLSEVLNNIVEHAYDGPTMGAVAVRVSLTDTELEIRVTDWGCPFPPQSVTGAPPVPHSLSEGGYGWFLIRSLTSRFSSNRTATTNRLTLTFGLVHEG